MAHLRVTVKDPDQSKVGRRFSRAGVELALAHYPGFLLTAPPSDATPYAVYWPTLVPAELVRQSVHLGDRVEDVEPTSGSASASATASAHGPGVRQPAPASPEPLDGDAVEIPIGRLIGARSGDKGGNANLGVWARSDDAYAWLAGFLTVERIQDLMPDTAGLEVDRYELPNLRAINFVFAGLLGEGVSSSTRVDPQAKSLGEYLRSKVVPVPVVLVPESHGAGDPAR